MHLGDDRYFVEETCLAHMPAVALPLLEARLRRRLAWRSIEVIATEHVERCFFPMNLPLPDLHQPIVGFGGAAAMVHPASGYQMGSVLQRAPLVARALAAAMTAPNATPETISRAGWQAVWPSDRLRRHQLYRFGLENLLAFDEGALHAFFITFFGLPPWMWRGYLSNTLTTAQLMRAMLFLFARAPHALRLQLMRSLGSHAGLLGRALLGRP
jgi:lycopene cyclase-like protein